MSAIEITTGTAVRLLHSAAFILTRLETSPGWPEPEGLTEGESILLEALLHVSTGSMDEVPRVIEEYRHWCLAQSEFFDEIDDDIPF